MFYWALPGEVGTRDLIRKAKEENKIVALPVVTGEKDMQPYEFTSESELVKGLFGIYEPKRKTSSKINVEDLSLVIVPATAFDLSNQAKPPCDVP